MTPDRYEQVGTLYQAALDREPAARAAFLAEACRADENLRLEVESLLAAHEHASDLIEHPPDDVAAGWQAAFAMQASSLAHYEMLSILGKGGMGEVWLAKDTLLGRKVALKLLPAEFTADGDRVRRFAQEARAASALNHPNIITIHEIGKSDNRHFIVTEYVEGKTLRQQMDAGRMTIKEALGVILQVTDALDAAHRSDIVHRDIKPENVMVRPDGYVKVLDFGLAKLVEPSSAEGNLESRAMTAATTESGMLMGTPRCMSPEQARGDKIDIRTDIFSLGVLLYEMVAGRAPFTGATQNDVIAAILKDEPPPLADYMTGVPLELERIVSKALRKNREERYQTVQDLRIDLRQLKDQVFIAQPPPVQTRTAKTLSFAGRRSVIVVLGAFVFVAAAVAAWFYVGRRPLLTSADTILLADFDNKTGEPIFDETLKQALAMHLEQSRLLKLLPEPRVRETLRLMERSPEERVTGQLAREICVRNNLKALIAGSIAPLGGHYVITLETINGQTGETLARQVAEAENKEQVLRVLTQAANGLREKLGENLAPVRRFDGAVEDATTANLEAFRFYARGAQLSISGKALEPIPLIKRAVEIDPSFAYAWSVLSIQYHFTGRPDLSAEYAAKAYALRDRGSEYEKLRITFWYHSFFTGNVDERFQVLALEEQMYPGKWLGLPEDLGGTYALIGQYDQAMAAARESIKLLPDFPIARGSLAESLLRLNHFAEAKDILSQLAVDQKLEATYFPTYLYEIAVMDGDAESIRRQLDYAGNKPYSYMAFDWQANAAAFAGQWRRAQELSKQAIDLTAQGDTKEIAARYASEQALRLAALSSNDNLPCSENRKQKLEIESLVQSALTLARGRASLPQSALALALCGDSDQAKALADELTNRYPQDTLFHSIWQPAIAAAVELQRDPKQTIERLQASRYEAAAQFWPPYLRGQAYLKLKQGAEAAAEFQKILDHRGYAPLSVLYPLAHLGIARAARLAGDLAKGRQAYANLLSLWKSADPDLPVLLQAKSEFQNNKQN